MIRSRAWCLAFLVSMTLAMTSGVFDHSAFAQYFGKPIPPCR